MSPLTTTSVRGTGVVVTLTLPLEELTPETRRTACLATMMMMPFLRLLVLGFEVGQVQVPSWFTVGGFLKQT
jgi:hypothetical protein